MSGLFEDQVGEMEAVIALWVATVAMWGGVVFVHFIKYPKQQMAPASTVLVCLLLLALVGFGGLVALALVPSTAVPTPARQYLMAALAVLLVGGTVFFVVRSVALVRTLLAQTRGERDQREDGD